jgi:hypothetical protein
VRLLIVVTLASSVIAGVAAYIVAFDRLSNCGYRGVAGRLALRAVPGPALFFLGLGTALGIAVPVFLH